MKHLHRLKKHKYKNGTTVFFCTLDCDYKVEAPLALGKEVICNQCNEPFMMNESSLKLVKPHCINCGKIKVKADDGKHHFINKRSTQTHVLAEIAEDTVDDLKSRLTAVVKEMPSEDI